MTRGFDLGTFVNPQQMAHGNIPMGKPKLAPPPMARQVAPPPPRAQDERPVDPAYIAAIMEGRMTKEQAQNQTAANSGGKGRRAARQSQAAPTKSYSPDFKSMPVSPMGYQPEGMHVKENFQGNSGARDYGAGQGHGHFNEPSAGMTDSPIGMAEVRRYGGGGNPSAPMAPAMSPGAYTNPEALAATKEFLADKMNRIKGFDLVAEARGKKPSGGFVDFNPITEDEDDPILSPLSNRRINFNQSGIFEVVITEDDNGLKSYDVVSPHGTTIAKDMSLHEAAEALTMCFNRGLFVNSVVVRNIIDADYAYTISRREAAKAKSLYESAKKKGNEAKAEEYARKFDEYRIKAKKAQSILQEALSGRR